MNELRGVMVPGACVRIAALLLFAQATGSLANVADEGLGSGDGEFTGEVNHNRGRPNSQVNHNRQSQVNPTR
jgi:K+-transporting ATPase c subunit